MIFKMNFSPSNCEIRQIKFGSSEWKKALELRNEVLRKPLNLEYSEEDLALEKDDFHFAVFDRENLIGFLLLKPISNSNIKMRQVAIHSDYQGLGVGQKLIQSVEEFARQNNFKKMYLDARESAIPFYLKSGYQIEGKQFIAVTLPHFRMWKAL